MLDVLKSVGKHFIVYGFGNVVNRLLGFLLIPFYTHYLTTSDYGTLDLIESTIYVAGMFLGLGISNSVLRFYFDTDDPAMRRRVVSTAHLSVWGVALFLGFWLVLFSTDFSMLVFTSTEQGGLYRLAFSSLILSVCAEVPMNFIRAQERSVLFTTIAVSRLVLALSLNILFLVGLGWGIRGILVSMLISQATATLVLSGYTFQQTGLGVSRNLLKQMISYALPYIPAGVSVFVLHFADRFILERLTSLSVLGVYALGYKFGLTISPLLTEPFLASWRPKMFAIACQENATKIYANMLTYFCFAGTMLALTISILIQDLITIISPTAFHAAREVVPLISFAYVVWGASLLVQVGVLLAKKTKYVAYVGGAAAVLNVGLNLVLIPSMGMWGAAWATLASCLLLLILGYHFSNRYLRVPYQWFRLFKLVAVGAGIYGLSLQISLGSLVLTIAVKILLILCFPLLLFGLRFYSVDEWRKIRELAGRGWALVKRT